ncbi:MAG: response regulator [Candidatus Liptonbacteria bacterium]|nr:response regulator [Candidatus Liptonbacteria bacterium]
MRPKPLILLVDDEADFREIISAKLTAAGFDVALAKNQSEAVAKAEQLLPDLILMDIYLPPGPTGTDTALNIRQNPKTKDLKIAFLTNLKEPWPAIGGDREKVTQELGMEGFIEKTEDLNMLVKKIQEILEKAPSS